MSTAKIVPLFSTPLYVNNVGNFNKPDLRFLEYTHKTPTGESFSFMSTVDKNVLERTELAGIRQLIMNEINNCVREVYGVSQDIEFYITNSWVNIYGKGDQAGAHIHHNSLLSGVLYLQVPGTGGEIVFHREPQSQLPFPPALDLDTVSHNIYNCKSWSYQPRTNDICIFPSIVSHSVQPNQSEELRWALSFNVFVRGKFGAIHKLDLK